jgi:hypothetical protein
MFFRIHSPQNTQKALANQGKMQFCVCCCDQNAVQSPRVCNRVQPTQKSEGSMQAFSGSPSVGRTQSPKKAIYIRRHTDGHRQPPSAPGFDA